MAYTADDATFQRHIENAVATAGRDRVWAGIGVYLNTFEGTLDKIRIAQGLGTRGIVLFSYDWAATQEVSARGRTFLERLGAEAFRR
jgi:hypothetical protein